MKASNFEDFTLEDCNGDDEPFFNCDDESYVESGEESCDENFDEPQNPNQLTFETC
jgi:hypothetical protein